MDHDFEYRYRAVAAKDGRFDGWFFTGVVTTGVFCRPSCPARTPRAENVRFFPSALSARRAGFRACKRCRPDAIAGAPGWNTASDAAARAMELIEHGVVDQRGVPGLACELGFSERHLHRLLVGAIGCSPLTLARAARVKRATLLLQTTDLPIVEVAFSAGFSSLRQFNMAIREVCGCAPTELRRGRAVPSGAGPGTVQVRLPVRMPYDFESMLRFLEARAIPGIEQVRGGAYTRSLRLPHGQGRLRVEAAAGALNARFTLVDLRDLAPAVDACRRLFDLDSDPQPIVARLITDPLLGRLVSGSPGRRVAGAADGNEIAVRALLGQQITIGAAVNLAARLVAEHGECLQQPDGNVTHLFPTAETIAGAELDELAMPKARRRALRTLAEYLVCHPLDGTTAATHHRGALLALPGIGKWTAGYISIRALRDPDGFLPGDAGVRRALNLLGVRRTDREVVKLAERWRPYRAYAVQHLWALDSTPAQREPRAAA